MTLHALAPDLWQASHPVRFLGLRLTANMTVVRLPDGGLVLHSPAAMEPALRAAVDALGPVRHLYAPNTFHHLHLSAWAGAYPDARVHGPTGLPSKKPGLRFHRLQDGTRESAFAGVLDEVRVGGFRLEECGLYHRPTRSLILADLLHNIGPQTHRWTRVYTSAMGFHDRVGLSRMIRWTAFPGRPEALRAIEALLALDLDRIVVGHGAPILDRPGTALAQTYAWLLEGPAPTAVQASSSRRPAFGTCG